MPKIGRSGLGINNRINNRIGLWSDFPTGRAGHPYTASADDEDEDPPAKLEAMRVVGNQTKGTNWLRLEVATLRKQAAKAAQPADISYAIDSVVIINIRKPSFKSSRFFSSYTPQYCVKIAACQDLRPQRRLFYHLPATDCLPVDGKGVQQSSLIRKDSWRPHKHTFWRQYLVPIKKEPVRKSGLEAENKHGASFEPIAAPRAMEIDAPNSMARVWDCKGLFCSQCNQCSTALAILGGETAHDLFDLPRTKRPLRNSGWRPRTSAARHSHLGHWKFMRRHAFVNAKACFSHSQRDLEMHAKYGTPGPPLLDALSWGDSKCTGDRQCIYARTSLMVSDEVPGILERWHKSLGYSTCWG
ncbi:hypothetical protein B0H14DRAFT_2591165 [Mycena olivaceomarginata]|nr:hypothetical protein B0H14DRAFT_2591165 [Mycena olivaceomarginata]